MSTNIITPRNTLGAAVLAALVLSWVYTTMGQPKSFEDRLAVADAVASEKCDISTAMLQDGPPAAAAVCAEWGTQAYLYTLKYPAAAHLYGLYGNLPELHRVLDRYGHGVIPVVWSFYLEGSMIQQTEHDFGRAVASILDGRMPAFDSETLSPIEHGAYAIDRIDRGNGYDVLARYEVENGDVSTKPLTSTLRTLEDLLLGGVKTVERKFARGETITAADYGFAALDVAVLAIGGNAIVSGLKKSGTAATAKAVTAKGFGAKTAVVLKTAGVGAGKSLLAVGKKVAPLLAIGGVGYLAVTDPLLVISAGGWILELAGVPELLALPIAATLFAVLVWAALWVLSRPVRMGYRGVRRVFRTA